jgi:hypothetical protein
VRELITTLLGLLVYHGLVKLRFSLRAKRQA